MCVAVVANRRPTGLPRIRTGEDRPWRTLDGHRRVGVWVPCVNTDGFAVDPCREEHTRGLPVRVGETREQEAALNRLDWTALRSRVCIRPRGADIDRDAG